MTSSVALVARLTLLLAALTGVLGLSGAWPVSAGQAEPAAAALWDAVDAVPSASRGVAPSLRLPALSGGVVDVRQLRGRIILVYFWASW